MRVTFIAMSLLCLVVLTACATTVPQNTTLKPNEGIAVVKLACPSGMLLLDLVKSGTTHELGMMSNNRDGAVQCGHETLQSIKLEEGNYYIGRMWGAGLVPTEIPEERSLKFSIHPNQLNYLGNWSMHALASKRFLTRKNVVVSKVHVANESEREYATMQAEQPTLLSKYDWTVSLAQH